MRPGRKGKGRRLATRVVLALALSAGLSAAAVAVLNGGLVQAQSTEVIWGYHAGN